MGRYLIKINAKQFTEIIYAALSGRRLLVDNYPKAASFQDSTLG